MPKINRIRIANIQYDKKTIKDLFLNCYNGENVLLNLANGGGKSVLVQLLQQPLLPESRIHNREVYHYLSPDQASYILLEWKLDNNPKQYLLTGIVMSKLFSSDDMNKTKYFTFLNEYQNSNEFDIKNIPFIQKQENGIVYKSYDAAMQMIRENKKLETLGFFGRGEQVEYRRRLAEYGIFVSEWKTLAKMNENEGGVDELFKDCKTSDNLVNKWILKAISDSSEMEGRELKEMFVSLMQEIIDKEKNLKEKEILEDFKGKVEEYQGLLNKLLEQLDQEKQVEKNISQIYFNFANLKKENQDKINQILEKMAENEKELEQIDYEEVSEEYYHLESDLEAVKTEKHRGQEQFELQKQVYEKANFDYRIQKVACLYEREKRALAKIEALKMEKSNVENQNNSNEQLLKIEYNLQEQYRQKIVEFNQKIEEIEQENEHIKKDVEGWKKQTEQHQKDINEFSTKIGALRERIEGFEKEEKVLFEQMNIFIARNLLNELEEKEVQDIKEKFENQIQTLKKEMEQNKNEIEMALQKMDACSKQEEQNHKCLQELIAQEKQKEMDYQAFQKQEEKVKQILNFHRMDEQMIFQKQAYMATIEEKRWEYKRKVEDLVSKIDRIKEYLLDLEQGGIHNSREVRKALEEAGIGYITGEKYLKQQQEEYRKELLEKNPLLPYCYIVEQEDLEKIKTLEIKEETNQLTPIITYSNIGREVEKENKIVQVEEICFLSLYHKDCFFMDTKQYQQTLEAQLESHKKRKTEQESELHRVEEQIRILENFHYQEKDKEQMKQELDALKKQIEDKRQENGSLKEQKLKLEKEIEERRQENIEKQENLRQNEKEQAEYLAYLNKNRQYCEDKKQKEICESDIKNKQQQIQNARNQMDEGQQKERNNVWKVKDFKDKLKDLETKNAKLPQREEKQEILDSSLEELEAQYEQLTKKYQQDLKQIDEQISDWSRSQQETQKERQKEYADISKEDYETISYSEEIEDASREKKEEEEKNLESKREEFDQINTKFTRIETKFKEKLESLRKIGKQEAIPASQIKGNYEARKEKIEQERKEGKMKQKEYEGQIDNIRKQMNEIERNVDIKEITQEKEKPIVEPNKIESVNFQEWIRQYKELKNRNEMYQKNIYKKYVDMSSCYQDKYQIVDGFLKNMLIQNAEEGDYETYYYIYEKIEECLQKLTDYIGVLNLSLQNIEQDKQNILQHAVKQGKMLYQEMKKISESSKVKIGQRYVQILKIEIPEELKEYGEERIKNHLQECILSLREKCKPSEDVKRTIEGEVANYLSDRQLLNLVLDVQTIKVKLYKFDIENKNSGLRQWEDVIVENSGGQKFVACFALFSALVEYTRRKELERLGEEEKVEASKVFILDNPFGKTSSKHLLEPMIEISKKFNIQMICLSDLSQSSITDKFALIYQLALRSSKYTNRSFLMIEDVRNNSENIFDTSLEQVFLRSETKQISLWNEG